MKLHNGHFYNRVEVEEQTHPGARLAMCVSQRAGQRWCEL